MDNIYTALLTYGPLGAFCVISTMAIIVLFRMYCEVQEKRITEARESQKDLRDFMDILQRWRDTIDRGK